MKNNFGGLKERDNSFFYNSENKLGNKNSKKISNKLNYSYQKLNRNNSFFIKPSSKYQIEALRNKIFYKNEYNSFLNDLRKITPILNLKYEIELYKNKGRYSLLQKDEIIDDHKYDSSLFIRHNFKNSFCYKPCLIKKGNQEFYNKLNKKSLCYGKFRSSFEKSEDSFSLDGINLANKNINEKSTLSVKNNNIKNIKSKNTTKATTLLSNSSRPFSSNIFLKKGQTTNKKSKNIYYEIDDKIKNKINETFEKANDKKKELNKDIYESKLNDFSYKFKKKKKKKKNENDELFELIKNQVLKDNDKDNLHKYRDLEKNVENKIIKIYKYFDKNGKMIFRRAMLEDKKIQYLLKKEINSPELIKNNKLLIKRLLREFSILGKNILTVRKKYKGEDAIMPKNEVIFMNKLLKENTIDNIGDDNLFYETKRNKIVEMMSDKNKEKILKQHHRSQSVRYRKNV